MLTLPIKRIITVTVSRCMRFTSDVTSLADLAITPHDSFGMRGDSRSFA